MNIDETLRERNLSAYEARYGCRPVIDPRESEKYRIETARNGEPVLYIYMSAGGSPRWVAANSTYDPSYEADRWALSRIEDLDNRATAIAMFGFGLGHQLRALRRVLRKDTDYLVYEPEEGLFSFVCGFVDMTDLILDRDHFFIVFPSDKAGSFHKLVESNIIARRAQAKGMYLPLYAPNQMFDDVCGQTFLSTHMNRNFQRAVARITYLNRIHAWTRLNRNAVLDDFLLRVPRELPIIIVAAGPSLNKNVEELKRVEGRALVVCTDRAVSTLCRHQIQPDLLITADADKSVDYLMPDATEGLPLLCSFQTNQVIQRRFDGRIIYFHVWEEQELPGMGERRMQGNIGGNVAGGALITFLEHGSHTIILIGQDLAMTGGQTHADGSDVGATMGARDIEVESIDGGTVISKPDWVSFRDAYEQMLIRYDRTRVIDATEGGALIHGTDIMTFRQAIDEVCTERYDIPAMFRDLPMAQTDAQHEETLALMEKWCGELDTIASKAEELAPLCEQFIKICRYHDVNDHQYDSKHIRMAHLRADIYRTQINDHLEHNWITNVDLVPDPYLSLRDSKEALSIFEGLQWYYEELPENCRSMKQAIEDALAEGREDDRNER